MANNREIGNAREKQAGGYLEAQGYQILTYNYYCHFGEIDIVARDGDYLVFCEVKYRKHAGSGHPLEAISRKKQHTIGLCALDYMQKNKIEETAVRFDVVGILSEEITVIKNAFEFV